MHTNRTILPRRSAFILCVIINILAFIGSIHPDTAHAQAPSCIALSGPMRSACNKEEARRRSEENRARRDAERAPATPGGASSGQAYQGQSPYAKMTNSRENPPASGGAYAEYPTIDRSVKPAMLTFVTHPAYSRTPGKLRMPIARSCANPGDDEMTFSKACRLESLHNFAAALPLFQQACQEGDPAGCFLYADHIEARQLSIANAMYAHLCDLGHPTACYRMALAYENGTGVPKSSALQRTYYDRACVAGSDYGCRFVAGKIDEDCPHGHRGWRADTARHSYKVVCVVDTGPLTTAEHEIKPRPGEVEAIKGMASQANTSLPQWWIDAINAEPNGAGCIKNDLQDDNGRPISGSGCIGVSH